MGIMTRSAVVTLGRRKQSTLRGWDTETGGKQTSSSVIE